MTRTISNSDDIIDSRDVIARIDTLEDQLSDAQQCDDADHAEDRIPDASTTIGHYCGACMAEDERAELSVLKALEDEASGSADWRHGKTLIRDSYFEDYARDLAEDIGAIPKELGWPACHIDWDAACESLKQDYMSVEFDDVTYWIRA